MKNLLFVGIVLLLNSCTDPDSCLKVSPFGKSATSKYALSVSADEDLVLEYVDAQGNNLFENGTLDPDLVTMNSNGETYSDVVDQYNAETLNMIHLRPYKENINYFLISLDPTSSNMDKITLYARFTDFSACTGPVVAIDSVFYNEEKQSLKKLNDWTKKVTIVK